MINAAVFDLEGTLIKLPIDYEALYEAIRKELNITKVQPLTRTAKKLDRHSREKLFRLWEIAEKKAFLNFSINKEGMDLYWKHANKPTALVTMQGKNIVTEIMNRLFLKFNIVVTREDSLERKKQIKTAIDSIGTTPDKVLFFGDRDSDEVAANHVGCMFKKVKT